MDRNDKGELLVSTPEQAEELLAKAEALDRGRGLICRIPEPVLDSHRERLRAALPHAVLRPVPPRRPYTLDWPKAYVIDPARLAKIQAQQPCEEVPRLPVAGGGGATTWEGSGVPAAHHPLAKGWFTRCMHCASTDTLVIRASSAMHYGRSETFVWEECEYLCRECGMGNYHQVNDEY
ncbi:MAG: hypothetical protein ACK4N5_01590 [Myxococcales bacterium]